MLASPESYQHVLACWRDEQDRTESALQLLTARGWSLIPPGVTLWSHLAALPSGLHACAEAGCD
jgi:hypothetical protein